MGAHQLARLALGCYTMNASRQGRNVLWYIETTTVVLGGCRRAFTVKGEKSMPKEKEISSFSTHGFCFPLFDEMHLFIKVG